MLSCNSVPVKFNLSGRIQFVFGFCVSGKSTRIMQYFPAKPFFAVSDDGALIWRH